MKFLLFLTLPFYALDQVTKWLVVKNIEEGGGFAVVPDFFNILHATNTGAAFSLFSNNNAGFIILSVAVLSGLAWFYRKGAFKGALLSTGLALLVAGIAGNLTDRVARGHVIDFLSFDLHVRFASPWPTFNVADSCIFVAAALFIVASFRAENKTLPSR